jgi:hypothetical protein
VVLVQHADGQQALGVLVTLGPQQPPGEQMKADPSPQLAVVSGFGVPPACMPRRIAFSYWLLVKRAELVPPPDEVALTVIERGLCAETVRPEGVPE